MPHTTFDGTSSEEWPVVSRQLLDIGDLGSDPGRGYGPVVVEVWACCIECPFTRLVLA